MAHIVIKNMQTTLQTLLLLYILFFSTLTHAQLNVDLEPIDEMLGVTIPGSVQSLNIPYDNIEINRQAFHLFLPDAEGTYPLVIYIHGGGFTGGSRDKVFVDGALQESLQYFLENGVAFISIGYRLLNSNGPDEEGVIKSLRDSKRALQFIRYHAAELKIDPERIALMGGSAGAGTSLWLATKPDMADPESSDPVLRESTRATAIFLNGSQATYDIPRWESEIYEDFDFTLEDLESILGFDRLSNFYGGLESVEQLYEDPTLVAYREEVDMLAHMTSDDPPVFINSGSGAAHPENDPFHHHAQSLAIQTHAITAGLPEVKATIKLPGIDTSEGETGEEFLVRYLMPEPIDDEGPVVTSSDQNLAEEQMLLYPNPTANVLHIKNTSLHARYQIYDLQGKLVMTGKGSSIDVMALSQGTYLLNVDATISRFIKQ